ncbi:hypothetical protein CDBH8_0763 [Corynebacterium diphtheriae BH8]|nr:hypothetical protein CD31A_0817 [Corynebacterium diphtheriae 31A]AEX48288.1 hypothetical protein CDBH8_0763 [Corynebacterium diphtheriae BH8]AEX80704.1 hypothetical protein CDHC04_0711 [Corynebacterium diphtheriae HC04]AEX82938.1 hypothetical protein CDVA01_0669 [Corynebacterium diphtheriae VA01]
MVAAELRNILSVRQFLSARYLVVEPATPWAALQ